MTELSLTEQVKRKMPQDEKLYDLVAYLNNHPQDHVLLTGYADKGTGNARINARLGQNRAKKVVDALVKVARNVGHVSERGSGADKDNRRDRYEHVSDEMGVTGATRAARGSLGSFGLGVLRTFLQPLVQTLACAAF